MPSLEWMLEFATGILALLGTFLGMPRQIYKHHLEKRCGLDGAGLFLGVAMFTCRVPLLGMKQSWVWFVADACAYVGLMVYAAQYMMYRAAPQEPQAEKPPPELHQPRRCPACQARKLRRKRRRMRVQPA